MTWALWLAVPVAATLLAALWSWVRARPRRLPGTAESMRAHTAYLDALGASARSRTAAPPPSDELPPPPADELPPAHPAAGAERPATSD